MKAPVQLPKILLYDIETSPNIGLTWGKYDQNVLRFLRERELLSVAYKWHGEAEVHFKAREKGSDKALAKHIRDVFLSADVLVAHNGDSFDHKVCKTRMLYHQLGPVAKPISMDTLKIAKRYFSFNGNSLDDLARYLKLGSKAKTTGIDLWIDCMKGDPQAWKTMEKYNKQDVLLLGEIFDQFRPWVENHPHIAKLMSPERVELGTCPACQSTNTQRRGRYATRAQVSRRWQCMSCGHWFYTAIPKGEK